MLSRIAPSRASILTAVVALCITFWLGLPELLAQSSCVSCHTEETLLKENLSDEKEEKSALTSGAG
jgi:hypothetical protein